MTCNFEGTEGFNGSVPFRHGARMGHGLEKLICSLLTVYNYYYFPIKGTEGTVKEGGSVVIAKRGEIGGKREKEENTHRIRAIGTHLCPLTFAGKAGFVA